MTDKRSSVENDLTKPPDQSGDQTAGAWVEEAYSALRLMASKRLSGLPPGQTLTPTALVHEVYVRLNARLPSKIDDDRHFFAIAATVMHDVLVDRARQKASLKRGGGRRKHVDWTSLQVATQADEETLLDLEAALETLRADDEKDYQIVLLRFFAGFSEEQTAEVTGLSVRSLQRRWQFIRARLHRLLNAD